MSDEHINMLRTLKGMSPLRYGAALDAAIAALGGVVEVGEVVVHGVVGVSFNAACNYGCDLEPGTKLYALPATPSKEG